MTTITICGNTTSPAELRFTPSGKAVTSFNVAVNDRRFDKAKNEWVDGDTTFYPCSAWGAMAENVAESLADKGVRVVVTGRIKSRTYQNKDGQDVTRFEIEVDEVGPCLRYATAKVTKTTPGWSDPGRKSHVSGSAGNWASSKPQGADPWAKSDANDDPPF